VECDRSTDFQLRERQLEAREQNMRESEGRLAAERKEVEEQRQRVAELVRQMQDTQVDDRSVLTSERERLETEHQRLVELQRTVKETDRNNRETLKRAWADLEDTKRNLNMQQMNTNGDLEAQKEDLESKERSLQQEQDRLKALHTQVDVARQNAARRIRETEATVANERRCLMSDLEVFEEKRRIFAEEVQRLDSERRSMNEERVSFDHEVRNVGAMAAEVQQRSEELKVLHEQAAEARVELLALRGALQEEREAQGSEMERLKTMQTLIEQQRLQLLQTENQLRVRGVEDIDLLVTTQASFPMDAQLGGGALVPAHQLGLGGGCGGGDSNRYPVLGLTPGPGACGQQLDNWRQPCDVNLHPLLTEGPSMGVSQGVSSTALVPSGCVASVPAAVSWTAPAVSPPPLEPGPAGVVIQKTPPTGTQSMVAGDEARAQLHLQHASPLASRGDRGSGPMPGSGTGTLLTAQRRPLLDRKPLGYGYGGAAAPGGSRDRLGAGAGGRMELQTLLRRTREASGETQVFIQEQYRFLQQHEDASRCASGGYPGTAPTDTRALPGVLRAGRGLEDRPMEAGRAVNFQEWALPPPPSSTTSDSFTGSYLAAEDLGFDPLRQLSSDYSQTTA